MTRSGPNSRIRIRHGQRTARTSWRGSISRSHTGADPALDTVLGQLFGQRATNAGDDPDLVTAFPRADGEVAHHHLGAADVIAAGDDVHHAHGSILPPAIARADRTWPRSGPDRTRPPSSPWPGSRARGVSPVAWQSARRGRQQRDGLLRAARCDRCLRSIGRASPTSVQTQGTPLAIASPMTSGKASVFEVRATRSAAASSSGMSVAAAQQMEPGSRDRSGRTQPVNSRFTGPGRRRPSRIAHPDVGLQRFLPPRRRAGGS